ncbi:MAG: hypothetical protein ABMA01_01530 [Chthoniobacteraceae bacterium]
MHKSLLLLLAAFLVSAHAFEWRSEIFHCSANLPDSAGWNVIEAPPTPGITVVVAMQNPGKQAVFGINIVEKLPGTDLADPAVKRAIEELLRSFSYQAIGHSVVKISGLDWLQYPVQSGSGAERITGMVRFTSAGGRVFSITALRGGGQEAAQDVELQQAAGSFRILQTMPPAKPAIAQSTSNPPPPTAPTDSKDAAKTPPSAEPPATGLGDQPRLIWYAAGGIAALLVFLKIISGGKSSKR